MSRKYTYKYHRAELAEGIPDIKKYQGVELDERTSRYFKTVAGTRRQIVFAEDIRDFVADFYDDPETGYFGQDKLYARISERFDGVSRREVAAVLADLEVASSQHPADSYNSLANHAKTSSPTICSRPCVHNQWRK